MYIDILLTCDGSEFDSELFHQGELIDRCIFPVRSDEYTHKVHNNYIVCRYRYKNVKAGLENLTENLAEDLLRNSVNEWENTDVNLQYQLLKANRNLTQDGQERQR